MTAPERSIMANAFSFSSTAGGGGAWRGIAVAGALVALAAAQLPAAAQPAPAAGPRVSASVPAGGIPAGLYDALGRKEGIARIMDRLVDAAFRDTRIGPIFKETKPQALKESLTDQICVLTGGPCVYEGADMKAAHADLTIRKSDFNALVELLQAAMDAEGVPFTQQSRLLALLAPMHRDVITVR
ncbi:group 1 truncated hemoglobin [Acidovorax sp. GBBC 3334]|uniref:group I truncated hemoglobin n=1 Tax=Acidovorax sp. GBBC 3334 TaxID=2940496 RepID=UPI0023049B6D|nr:group 1 truncated hemoglobin [Acidovorax sp. GBBC 3334]MDA8454709.1 group 1 truncated hemoglobin [Acidovorax sp. GBBC 3334]